MAQFFPQELIRHKRDGGELAEAEIEFLVDGLTDGSVSDGQIAAFAMAVFFRGMTMAERVALTRAMTRSGDVLDWADLDLGRPVLDKHSTGGVGDKVSLILAPIVAACGGAVPMISGRGLGHTGGTLDKLDSIPGYDTTPSAERFREVVREAGCAIIGQTADLAPADRRFYSIRDVTATVESIPLITASILSKKLAAGLERLVMDVKFGSGAFMAGLDDAIELAESIVGVAKGAGLRCSALVTDMNQVLGRTAGNALEVIESIEQLVGTNPEPRLREVTSALSAELLVLGGLAVDPEDARTKVHSALTSGRAAEQFGRMVVALGGPASLLEGYAEHLPVADVRCAVLPEQAGVVQSLDVRGVGLTVMALGGGRRRASDDIDPAVGLTALAGVGEAVGPDRALAVVHARDESAALAAADSVRGAYVVADAEAPARPTIARRIA